MIVWLLSLALIGLIAGAIARLLVPGRDPLGLLGTMALGIVGAFVAGFLARLVFDDRDGVGLLGAVVGAVLCLLALRALGGGGRRTSFGRRRPARW